MPAGVVSMGLDIGGTGGPPGVEGLVVVGVFDHRLPLFGTGGGVVEDLGQGAGCLLGFLFPMLSRGVCLLVFRVPAGFPSARALVLAPALAFGTGGGGWRGGRCGDVPCSWGVWHSVGSRSLH